jgi:hypothetical protein
MTLPIFIPAPPGWPHGQRTKRINADEFMFVHYKELVSDR